jgi:hypothetical protein
MLYMGLLETEGYTLGVHETSLVFFLPTFSIQCAAWLGFGSCTSNINETILQVVMSLPYLYMNTGRSLEAETQVCNVQ